MRPDLDRRVTQPSRLSPRHYAGQPRPLPSRPPRTRSTLSLHDALPIYPSVDDAGMLRAAALALRGLLDELGLPSWVKTSGSKGFHIVVPLDGKRSEEHTSELQSHHDLVCRLLLEKKNAARSRPAGNPALAPLTTTLRRPASPSPITPTPHPLHSFPTRRSSDLSVCRRCRHAARRSACASRPARRTRTSKLGEDLRLQGIPHRRPPRRQEIGRAHV